LRHYKPDELFGLWDVLIGNINSVCPRPDVPGYADKLKDRVVLKLRSGITGQQHGNTAWIDIEMIFAMGLWRGRVRGRGFSIESTNLNPLEGSRNVSITKNVWYTIRGCIGVKHDF
jgi:hypothetical protein